MPLFGSRLGGAAGATGSSRKSEETLQGTRPKENAGEGTTGGASPLREDTSRETSPCRSPTDETCKRDRYALLIGVQLADVDKSGPQLLPHYAWNETVIKDILSVEIRGISDIVILSPIECMVYTGQRSKGQGFTQAEAVQIAGEMHNSHTLWIGRHVRMRCVPRTLRDAKVDLKSAKDYI